jgi:adenosine deaminase
MMDSKTLPKVELHCHVDGILEPSMVRDIHRDDPTYPIDPGHFEQAYPVTGMQNFFQWFNYISPINGELSNFRPILGRYIERLKAQRVLYSEVMIAASHLPQDKVEAVEKVRAFREWVNRQESGDIQIEFLICCGRNRPLETMEERAERILLLHGAGLIVGVALAGPEQGYPVKPFRKTFARFHEAGLNIEVHAGEWCGPESVWDALEYGYPNRIGHGVSLFQDARLIDMIRDRHIHIEMCPTSNLKTGSISRIEEHPIRKAKELGLSFSVNTDDPGAFECSMESEYALLVNVLGFSESDLQTLYANSLEARFQPKLRVSQVDVHAS